MNSETNQIIGRMKALMDQMNDVVRELETAFPAHPTIDADKVDQARADELYNKETPDDAV